MQGRIYGLFDPRTPNTIRYIGQTRHSAENRRDAHVYRATHYNRNFHCDSWIRKLSRDGVIPGVRVFIEGDWTSQELDNHEIMYISRYKMLGHPLTNMTAGGRGLAGYKQSPEHREKISASKRGKPRDMATLAKLSKAFKGRKLTPEHKAAIGRASALRTLSPESRAKLSAAQRASRWQCDECEMVTTAGALGRHQKKTKHTGRHRP